MVKVLLAILLSVSVVTGTLERPTTWKQEKDILECMMIDRMQSIENMHGIQFDDDWKPSVCFGYANNLTAEERDDWLAEYSSRTQSFKFSPKSEYKKDLALMDHELGHALMDQVSRRNGYGPWPNFECTQTMNDKEYTSVEILSEGAGSYFEFKGQEIYTRANEDAINYLPTSPNDRRWKDKGYKYKGGWWVVAPIIKEYGERGLVYLITHPVEFDYGNLRAGAKTYRAKALKELADTAAQRPK